MEKKKVNDCLVVFKSINTYLPDIVDNALLMRDIRTDTEKPLEKLIYAYSLLVLNIDSNTSYECDISRSVRSGTSNIQFEFSLSPYQRVARGRASDTYHNKHFFSEGGRGRGLLSQDGYANSYSGLTKHHQSYLDQFKWR